MKQNSVSKPLSFTVLEVNDEPMISGGLISDASRFEDDDELMELAMQSCDDPVFHVNYTGYVWDIADGDVVYPTSDELGLIHDLYDRYDKSLIDHLDFVASGSYEIDNPYYDE